MFQYSKREDGVWLTGYRGQEAYITIPEQYEDLPVTGIGKKCFVGNKKLKEIAIPDSVTLIEDWAFANCSQLEKISLPAENVTYGKGVFQGCRMLHNITPYGCIEEMGALLAATVNGLDAPHLFSPKEAGTKEWISRVDSRIISFLEEEDSAGFTVVILCGEEDYGGDEGSLPYFLRQKRKAKVRMAFLRLLNPEGLEEDTKNFLLEYLRNHTKGCESEETWEVVLKEHGQDRAYYEAFARFGCMREDNFEEILSDIGEDCTEMKAFFIKYKEENWERQDFFAGLSL